MARTRFIKPEFFLDEELAECGPHAHLLFAALWCHCDKEGRMVFRPTKIKAKCLPFYDVDVEELVYKLEEFGFVQRYGVDGKEYLLVRNFVKHQKPHHREPDSELPPPDGFKEKPGLVRASSGKIGLIPLTNTLTLNPCNASRSAFADSMPNDAISAQQQEASTPTVAAPPDEAAAADPVVLTFPVVGRDASWRLRESKLAEYRETYPAVDVLAECRKALQWLRDNPRNTKTASGMPRFLGGWLSRCQNTARREPSAVSIRDRLNRAKEKGA